MLLFQTHIVLGETGNVARYCLKPVQAVFSCGKLYDSAANSVHSYDLESIFPERIERKTKAHGIIFHFLAYYYKLHTDHIFHPRKPLVSIYLSRG